MGWLEIKCVACRRDAVSRETTDIFLSKFQDSKAADFTSEEKTVELIAVQTFCAILDVDIEHFNSNFF